MLGGVALVPLGLADDQHDLGFVRNFNTRLHWVCGGNTYGKLVEN